MSTWNEKAGEVERMKEQINNWKTYDCDSESLSNEMIKTINSMNRLIKKMKKYGEEN